MASVTANTAQRLRGLTVTSLDLGGRLISYEDGLDLQRTIHSDVARGNQPPTVLLLEHEEVFTAGRRTRPEDVTVAGTRVVPTDRGGRITWHGPGQLVCYPIVPLVHPLDVVAFVRLLEQIMIDSAKTFGVSTLRVEGRSGAWCAATATQPERKVGAVGVRVASGVAMHGFAINANCDLSWAGQVVPCGISDAGVTSLSVEAGRDISVLDLSKVVEPLLHSHLGCYVEPTMDTQ